MHNERSSPLLGLTMAAALIALPAQLVGQDVPQQQQQQAQQQACTAQVQPMQVRGGGEAERVTVTLSQPGAEITGFEAPEGSNIELASTENIPRSPLAGADQPRPEPIGQGEAENQWVVYLDLSDAESGTHELTFTIQQQGQQARPGQPDQPASQLSQCTASIMVQ